MFERPVQPKAPPFFKRLHVSWRVAFLLSGLGLVALGLVAGWLLIDRQSLPVALDRGEAEVKAALVRLTRTPIRDARAELHATLHMLRRQSARIQHQLLSPEPEEIAAVSRGNELCAEMIRLQGNVECWDARLGKTSSTKLEEAWVETLVEVLTERNRWPVVGGARIVCTPRMRDYWREVQAGLKIGMFWPALAVRNAFPPASSSYGIFRRAFFPYGPDTAFRLTHLASFALAALSTGCGLCWIGMRFNRAWASYWGLLYFLYFVVFCFLVLGIQRGFIG